MRVRFGEMGATSRLWLMLLSLVLLPLRPPRLVGVVVGACPRRATTTRKERVVLPETLTLTLTLRRGLLLLLLMMMSMSMRMRMSMC